MKTILATAISLAFATSAFAAVPQAGFAVPTEEDRSHDGANDRTGRGAKP